MRVMTLELPDQAIEQAQAAIVGEFRLEDVRGALARALHDLEFDFGIQSKMSLLDRAADRILQNAKKLKQAKHVGAGRWKAL